MKNLLVLASVAILLSCTKDDREEDTYLYFTFNESKINGALKKLENRNIFVDISKNLNSFKLNKFVKNDYESLLEGMSGMFELSSSILWTKENSDDSRLKKELTN